MRCLVFLTYIEAIQCGNEWGVSRSQLITCRYSQRQQIRPPTPSEKKASSLSISFFNSNSSAKCLLNGNSWPQNIRSDELCSLADQQQAESTGVISPLGHSLRTRAPVQGPVQGEIFYTKELPLTVTSIASQQIKYPK